MSSPKKIRGGIKKKPPGRACLKCQKRYSGNGVNETGMCVICRPPEPVLFNHRSEYKKRKKSAGKFADSLCIRLSSGIRHSTPIDTPENDDRE